MKSRGIVFLFYIAGLAMLTFGISLIINAGLGAGPWDALFVGLAANLGLTVGSWTFIIGFILILINGALLKERPDFAALITMFLIGIFIDFWLLIVFGGVTLEAYTVRGLVFSLGVLSSAFGIASYLQSNFARNPIDNAMMVFHELTGKSLSFSKTFLEVSILIVAFFIGGPIGVGTVIVAFGIGPLIQLFYRPITAFRHRLAGV